MQILISNGSIKLTRLLKEHIEKRVGLALGRFADRIRKVSVKFLPGVSNGKLAEKLCRIDIAMRKKVSVESSHSDPFAAVNRALDHAISRVSKVLDHESLGELPTVAP